MRHVRQTTESLGPLDGNQIIHTNSQKFRKHSSHTLGRKDMTMKKVLGILTVIGLMAGAAQAASLTGALAVTSDPNLSVQQWQLNDLSVADFYDLDANLSISQGDVILGAFVLDSVQGPLGQETLDNVAGVYAIEVSGVVGNTATFGALSASNATNFGLASVGNGGLNASAGEMFMLTQGPLATNPIANPFPGSFSNPAYSDNDLYGTFDAPGYSITFVGTGLPALAAATGTTIGNIDLGRGLNIIRDGSGDGGEGIFQINPLLPTGGFDVGVNGSIVNPLNGLTPPQGAIASFNDSAQFLVAGQVIPLPSAVWAGLVLMGGLPIARRFRRRSAEL